MSKEKHYESPWLEIVDLEAENSFAVSVEPDLKDLDIENW